MPDDFIRMFSSFIKKASEMAKAIETDLIVSEILSHHREWAIDYALATGDKELFMRVTSEVMEVNK